MANPPLSDADYAEAIHAAGVAPDSAIALTKARKSMAAADLAEHLHANGLQPSDALKYAALGTGEPSPDQPSLASRVGNDLLGFVKHPINSIVGGVKSIGTSANDALLRPVQDEAGKVHDSWGEDPIGAFGGKVLGEKPIAKADWRKAELGTLGNAAGVFASAIPGAAGASPWLSRLAGGALGSGVSGAANNPQDPLASGIASAVAGGTLASAGGAAGQFAANKIKGPLVQSALRKALEQSPNDIKAAYQNFRAQMPVSDPNVVGPLNQLVSRQPGKAAYVGGQGLENASMGQAIPDLPPEILSKTVRTAPPSPELAARLAAAGQPVAGAPAPTSGFASWSPAQIDMLKQGISEAVEKKSITAGQGARMEATLLDHITKNVDPAIPPYPVARQAYQRGLALNEIAGAPKPTSATPEALIGLTRLTLGAPMSKFIGGVQLLDALSKPKGAANPLSPAAQATLAELGKSASNTVPGMGADALAHMSWLTPSLIAGQPRDTTTAP